MSNKNGSARTIPCPVSSWFSSRSNRTKGVKAMARPIPLTLPVRDPRAELQSRLENAPVEHAEAVLAAFEVLQGLHDCGALDLARGALGSSDKVLEIAVDAAQSPQSIR